MDFEDFINNRFNDKDPTDLNKLIDFLEREENLEKLFKFWNSLKSFNLQTSISDEIYEEVLKGT